jgi:hypothetical protein
VFDCSSGLPLIWVPFSGDSPVKLCDVRYILQTRAVPVSWGADSEDGPSARATPVQCPKRGNVADGTCP